MIYVVEDDSNIRELLLYTLQNSGLEACGFGQAARRTRHPVDSGHSRHRPRQRIR